ncbi:hypothetical protein HMPREF9088_2020, partial [Enterococcus italicus DSM 15952]
MGIYKE